VSRVDPKTEPEARSAVELAKLRLCSAALSYAGEESAFDLMVAASHYAEAVATLRRLQRRKGTQCTPN